MAESAPNNETWEAMLERLAGKTSIANEVATLIDALTIHLLGIRLLLLILMSELFAATVLINLLLVISPPPILLIL